MANTYTNATALTAAIAIVKENSTDMELVAKLERMATIAAKPRTKQTGPTKAQRERLERAKEVRAAIAATGEPQGSRWIMEHVKYLTSTQAVTATMRTAVEHGWIEVIRTPNKPILYRAL